MNAQDFKRARQQLNLSQSELAKLLGWSSVRQITNIENEARDIQPQTELAIECLLRRKGRWKEFQEGS